MRRLNRKSLLGAALLTLHTSLFFACATSSPPDSSPVVRIGLYQHASSIPIIVAKERGYFEQRGLQVQLINVSGEAQMPTLMRADVDVISPSTFPVIFSTALQNPGRIQCYLVGGESINGETLYGVVVKKESSYKTLGDLVGKTIGSPSKFTTVNLRNVLRYKFRDIGGSSTIREVPDKSLLIASLQDGTLDAAVVDQPLLSSTVFEEQFRIIERNFRAQYLDEPYWSGAGVARIDWIKANTKRYEAFLDAIDDALTDCKREPSAAKQAFIRFFNLTDLSPDAIGMYIYPGARHVPPETFTKALIKMLADNQLLQSEFDPTEVFYHR